MSADKPQNDGVVNPTAGLALLGSAPVLYVAAVPLANFITRPGGVFESLLNGVIKASAFVGTAGTTSSIPAGKVIPLLSALYLFGTYSLGGTSSAAAIASSCKEGRDGNNPRAQVRNLVGLPLRAHSAAEHLMEVFPSYALVAALTATLDPTNQQLINLLGLHVVSKLFVFWPAYIANLGAPRSLAHVIATSSLLGVAYKLALN